MCVLYIPNYLIKNSLDTKISPTCMEINRRAFSAPTLLE
jgi:hypothetical protein